ncbi:MAG: Fe-S protein assembly co-chaperone HscB [Gammaproteobacteria bacterium]|nr:Fe-S protein assembly co-chaperone HscB [Gammaproteobacteria bacterium]
MRAIVEKNYFELFGLPVGFDLDTADLAVRYRELQRQFHPDRHASSTGPERLLSLQITARINQGFQTLKEPLARGRYLLALRGVNTDEETDTSMDPDFLVEQMEMRESLDEARQSANRGERLARLASETSKLLRARTDALAESLSGGNPESLRRARELVREMQFLAKLAREVEELEEAG